MTYGSRPVEEVLSAVAAGNATPAGGTVAAVVGAAGASLCEMACRHAIDRADDPPTDLADLGEALGRRRNGLLGLADADADAVEALLSASGDDGPDPERETRRAVGVPLTIAEGSAAVADDGARAVERCLRPTVPDAVTGVTVADAAVRASALTVRTNLARIPDPDPDFAGRVRRRVRDATDTAAGARDRATARGASRLDLDSSRLDLDLDPSDPSE